MLILYQILAVHQDALKRIFHLFFFAVHILTKDIQFGHLQTGNHLQPMQPGHCIIDPTAAEEFAFSWYLTYLIETPCVHNRLCVMISAEHHQQIGNHGCLSFFVQIHNLFAAQPLKSHLHHAYRTIHNHLSGIHDS